MHAYLRAYKHTHSHAHIHLCMHICIHRPTYVYKHTNIHIYIPSKQSYNVQCTCIHVHTNSNNIIQTDRQTCIHSMINKYGQAYIHTSMHTKIHTYICLCLHMCMRTWIKVNKQSWRRACMHTMYMYLRTTLVISCVGRPLLALIYRCGSNVTLVHF